MRRAVQLGFSVLAVLVLLIGTAASSAASARGTTYMKIKQTHSSKPRPGSNLYYHGGSIQQAVQVVIVYWGTDWTTTTYTGARSYIEGFFNGVGGSPWAASTTQYCSGVARGTTQCNGAGTSPSNPANKAIVFQDGNAVPPSPTQSQIAAQAVAAANQLNLNNADVNYMVFTPSGHSESGFGTQWCAYHSSSGSVSYSYMPYQPDAGAACGQGFVSGASNPQLEGFTIVGGHEYGETITDPYPSTGWLDGRGQENGDKCAWISSGTGAAGNISLSTGSYAVQTLWSNATSNCVISYP